MTFLSHNKESLLRYTKFPIFIACEASRCQWFDFLTNLFDRNINPAEDRLSVGSSDSAEYCATTFSTSPADHSPMHNFHVAFTGTSPPATRSKRNSAEENYITGWETFEVPKWGSECEWEKFERHPLFPVFGFNLMNVLLAACYQ